MDIAVGRDGAAVAVAQSPSDRGFWNVSWFVEKWSEEAVDFARKRLLDRNETHIEAGVQKVYTGEKAWDNNAQAEVEQYLVVPRFMAVREGVTSSVLRALGIRPEDSEEIQGNLLLNEGIQRMWDLVIAAGGTAYNNANAYMGVGDTNTAAAATQTELQATENAANRFYKAMNGSYPQRTNQTVDFQSDFTSTEANFAWEEWTVAAGATTASGSGFLVGTTNMNRKAESLGTKATGTWTLTASITIS